MEISPQAICIHVMRLLAISIAVSTLALADAILAGNVRFDELVAHPERFNGRRISVVGVAEDGGDRIDVYRDIEARRGIDLAKAFMAYIPPEFPNYPGTNMGHYVYANARWVRVTGVVDTRIRGRWGDERFGLRLQSLTLLPKPRLMEFVCISAIILNTTASDIAIEVRRDDGGTYFGMSADDTAADACISENGTVTAILRGKQITSRPLIASQASQYYNARRKEYYYRVTERSVVLVPPSEARHWKRYPTPERDP